MMWQLITALLEARLSTRRCGHILSTLWTMCRDFDKLSWILWWLSSYLLLILNKVFSFFYFQSVCCGVSLYLINWIQVLATLALFVVCLRNKVIFLAKGLICLFICYCFPPGRMAFNRAGRAAFRERGSVSWAGKEGRGGDGAGHVKYFL